MTARSNPLAQKQPVGKLEAVTEALRQGLEGQAAVCAITVEPHKAGPKGREVEHQLFFIRAHGAEWHVSADMSEAAAFSTGQALARMVVAAGERKAKASE